MIKETFSNAVNKAFLYQSCRINAALDVISGRWKARIISYISEEQNRFSLLKAVLVPVSDQTLGRQLKELELSALMTKTIRAEVPVRVDYHLTEKTSSTMTILQDFHEWNDR